jgi:hypothetical protein
MEFEELSDNGSAVVMLLVAMVVVPFVLLAKFTNRYILEKY